MHLVSSSDDSRSYAPPLLLNITVNGADSGVQLTSGFLLQSLPDGARRMKPEERHQERQEFRNDPHN